MYLFFDTETTGLPKNWNAPISDLNNWPRMIQLAYLLQDKDGNELEAGNFLVIPEGFTIPHSASHIHGITTEKAIDEGWELKSVLERFALCIPRAEFIVGHNIRFDRKIVGAEFLRTQMADLLHEKPRHCTMMSGRKYFSKWPKLEQLHRFFFNAGFEGAHDADADIRATAKCFWQLKLRGDLK